MKRVATGSKKTSKKIAPKKQNELKMLKNGAWVSLVIDKSCTNDMVFIYGRLLIENSSSSGNIYYILNDKCTYYIDNLLPDKNEWLNFKCCFEIGSERQMKALLLNSHDFINDFEIHSTIGQAKRRVQTLEGNRFEILDWSAYRDTKNEEWTFGCGAVVLPESDIREFVKVREVIDKAKEAIRQAERNPRYNNIICQLLDQSYDTDELDNNKVVNTLKKILKMK